MSITIYRDIKSAWDPLWQYFPYQHCQDKRAAVGHPFRSTISLVSSGLLFSFFLLSILTRISQAMIDEYSFRNCLWKVWLELGADLLVMLALHGLVLVDAYRLAPYLPNWHEGKRRHDAEEWISNIDDGIVSGDMGEMTWTMSPCSARTGIASSWHAI